MRREGFIRHGGKRREYSVSTEELNSFPSASTEYPCMDGQVGEV